jgi:hypothetical protein
MAMLRRHVLYNSYQDVHNGVPEELCHKAWPEDSSVTQHCGVCDESGDVPSEFATIPRDASDAQCATPAMSPAEALAPPRRAEVEEFLKGRYLEVMVIVEGIEPTTSCSLQARHSYLFPSEVEWDMDFKDCMQPGTATRPCTVDLFRFHQLVPAKSGSCTSVLS